MEPRVLLSLLLVVIVFNPSFVLNLIIGYIMGIMSRSNISKLKAMCLGKKEEHNEEEESLITQKKNPFEDADPDVLQHLKTLGLDTKVDDEDLEYLQRVWKSIRCNK
ncbi:U4 protein [Faba bean yellow leaf virus]|uniref:U4 protein n=1 Tax=Faba bean yellow leaf virus TaxID=1137801 RepID=K4Q5W4_9VIRU|nr:U4 protein [Faba bean yellow leaf virus]CCF74120.1 U4 protein [Faba bean yellow leaf virus]